MKRVAFVFRSAPHGTTGGREGLDALLAASALSDDIGVFFIGDGVLQLLPDQKPAKVLGRDYIATFRVLQLYDIEQCFACASALGERGISPQSPLLIEVVRLDAAVLRKKLDRFDVVLTF